MSLDPARFLRLPRRNWPEAFPAVLCAPRVQTSSRHQSAVRPISSRHLRMRPHPHRRQRNRTLPYSASWEKN